MENRRVKAESGELDLSFGSDQHGAVVIFVDEVVDGEVADCPDIIDVDSEHALAEALGQRGVAGALAMSVASEVWPEAVAFRDERDRQ